jgi:hypothetical protein
VSQALAGNQWGAMVIPRIGQEVIVSFLGGNPDRPIIIGSLYNTANATPYNLPAHKTRTTFKSHSTPGGDGFNELRIEDKKGSEQIYLRGQKDLDLYVRNDWKEWVGNELHHTVGNNANQSIGGDQNTRINSSQHQKIGNNASQNVGQTLQLSVSGSHVEQAGQLISLKAGMTLVIDAGVELTLKAGAGLVKLDPSGITIQGPLVRINSGGVAQAAKAAELTSPQVPVAAQTGAGPGKASAAAMPNQAVGVGDKHRAYTNEGGFISTLHPESTNRDFVAGMMGLTDVGIASRSVRVVPDKNFDILNQAGKVDSNGFIRTEGIGSHASMSELLQSGALPGTKGVTLTDRTVRFGDVYELGRLDGRKVEFALTTERVDGKLVKRLYSGNAWTSPVPKDSRLIGHVHPNETATQLWPSVGDMNTANARYYRQLLQNPSAKAQPTRIFWGTGNTDNTIFYPGFGKTPQAGGSN